MEMRMRKQRMMAEKMESVLKEQKEQRAQQEQQEALEELRRLLMQEAIERKRGDAEWKRLLDVEREEPPAQHYRGARISFRRDWTSTSIISKIRLRSQLRCAKYPIFITALSQTGM